MWFSRSEKGPVSVALRGAVCCVWGMVLMAASAYADRIGSGRVGKTIPGLAGKAVQAPASWQTRRDYSRLPVGTVIALPALSAEKAAARLAAAEPRAPLQIGFARQLPEASRGNLAASAGWVGLPGGGRLASFSVRSPGAASLRLAIRARLPEGSSIRFFAAGKPGERYPPFKWSDFAGKADSPVPVTDEAEPGFRWSPTVSGDTMGVEVEIPPFADPAQVHLQVLRASHISGLPFAEPASDGLTNKNALACEPVEAVCKQLPSCPNDAVVRITFTEEDGNTYTCTGTALNTTRSEFDNFDAPYLLTAHHCIQTAGAADSLVTYWWQEHETCGGTTLRPDYLRLQRGAELVSLDVDSDSTLLRLRDGLPNGACLAAWDATGDWLDGTEIESLHHPESGVKEWAGGHIERTGGAQLGDDSVDTIDVAWSEGATRRGSSGAGLFVTTDEGEAALIGALAGGPADDCSRDSYGRFDRFFANHAGVHLLPTEPPPVDDHGGTADDATGVLLGSETAGQIDDGADADVFRVDVLQRGTLTVYTSGALDTFGRLKREDGSTLDFDDDGGHQYNFRIEAQVTPGSYYVKVTGYDNTETGSYRLHVEFTPASVAGKVLVPLFLSAARWESDDRQGFVRVFNRTSRSGEVRITGTDDRGESPAAVTLSMRGFETRAFNSEDLESGNAEKMLSAGIGAGTGDWRLEFDSDLDIDVAAYIRTRDGFLTSMHDLVVREDRSGAYHVPLFNPAENQNQRSRLRLINPDTDRAVQVTITGYGDDGEPGAGDVELRLMAGEALTLTASQLESGDANLTGRLGDGRGKWRLFVEADGEIHVVSLLDSETGNLTNLSSPAGDNYSQ